MATDRSDKKFMPDDHSKLVPLLPIPNRTVKRLRADDSAGSRVKVGHRQAPSASTAPRNLNNRSPGGFGISEIQKYLPLTPLQNTSLSSRSQYAVFRQRGDRVYWLGSM